MSCPFCGATLRDAPAPHALAAGVLLGLTLFGCGGDSAGAEEGNGESVSAGSTETSSSATGTESTTENLEESAEAADYGGPETSLEDTGPLPESSGEDTGTDTGDSSGGDTTGGESTGGESTGTDTGEGTTDASAEGADYGAAPPQPER